MTVAAMITANQILTRVGVEVGLEVVADPYGSQDPAYVQMSYLLQTAGEELCLAYPWEFLVKLLEFTTIDGQQNYPLPADFQSVTPDTAWDLTEQLPLFNAVSAQEYEAVKATNTISTWAMGFRIAGGEMLLTPPPPDAHDISMQYQSRYFVQSGLDASVYQPNITIGADKIMFDRTLITRYLKLMWLEAKGFDTSAAQQNFNQIFSFLTGKDKSGATLNAGNSNNGFRYLNRWNTPDSGFGL